MMKVQQLIEVVDLERPVIAVTAARATDRE